MGADKPTGRVVERGPGGKMVEGAKAKNRQSRRRNLRLSLRGSVEKQAQHEAEPAEGPVGRIDWRLNT